MGSNPLNLLFRFLLEIAALLAFGYWGWTQFASPWRWLLAGGLPVLAAALWGTFAVPDDPSRSGSAPIPVPGLLRLLLELVFFVAAGLALVDAGQPTMGIIFLILVAGHYAISFDRIGWLRQH